MTDRADIAPPTPRLRDRLNGVGGWLKWQRKRFPERLIALGLPPSVFGWRTIQHISPEVHIADFKNLAELRSLEPAESFENALPGNIDDRQALNPDAGWWGYAMRDVPHRRSDAIRLATLTDVRVLSFLDGPKRNFTPAVLDSRNRAIDMPQVRFRPGHAALMRKDPKALRLKEAVWFLERVYDNHSHWLTAHLPKLILLKDLGLLDKTIMPAKRSAAINASLDMIGIDPTVPPQYEAGTVLHVDKLTVPLTDRFDPRLLRPVREAFANPEAARAEKRVFISRARSRGRQLRNEDQLWPKLEALGFQRVFMEDLDFPEQVRLMQQSAILLAPHGAGLTNMVFCPEGTDVIELADPSYPNPNFYALASAMGHRYWLLDAQATGTGHALEKDLTADLDATMNVVERILKLRGL